MPNISTTSRGASHPPDATLRTLLVEDHPDTAGAMAAMLRIWGHRVVVAGSVAEALDAAKAAYREGDGLDLVICDIGLPDGNGWELMRILDHRFHVPGIAVTAYTSDADRARSLEAGFRRHLAKPVQLDELQSALLEVAHGTPGAEGGGAEDER